MWCQHRLPDKLIALYVLIKGACCEIGFASSFPMTAHEVTDTVYPDITYKQFLFKNIVRIRILHSEVE